MARTSTLARTLWVAIAAGGLACGRVGFDASQDATGHSDGPTGTPALSLGEPPSMASTCGSVADQPGMLAVTNTGTGPLVITTISATGGFSVPDPEQPLVVAPGSSITIPIAPPAAVIGTDRGGDVKFGGLHITSNDAASPHVVTLSTTITGANLSIDLPGPGSGSGLVFSAASGLCPAPQVVTLHDTGNTPAMATAPVGAGLATSYQGGPIQMEIGSGSGFPVAVRVDTSMSCVGSGTMTFAFTGPVCTTTPLVLDATYNITGSSSCFCS